MPNIEVKDANGDTVAVPISNANGRQAAAASRPVALSTEDLAALAAIVTKLADVSLSTATLAALETISLDSPTLAALESITATVTGVATEAKQDTAIAAINALTGTEYESFAASTAETAIGATGAVGDLLVGILIVPSSTSPGAVSIKDGTGGTSIPVFAGGASSVSTLHPFFVPLGIRAGAAQGWRITTGAGLSAVAVGNFT